jgi:uncharacterized membrane protein YphA (DoxX/SURF4 family)
MKAFPYASYAPVMVRLAISAVVMWFGVSQLTNPSMWLGVVPAWATGMGLTANTIIFLNGIFEVIASILLAIGLFVRPVAALLGLHLLVITHGFGPSATGVRDFGLSLAAFGVALAGEDRWSIHARQEAE